MSFVTECRDKVLAGGVISREEALALLEEPLDELTRAADEIRQKCCGDVFDLCTIVNGKCGRCSEDCKYCAQSVHYPTHTEGYPLLSTEELVSDAKKAAARGIHRYSIVTSGKRLPKAEVARVCESIRAIRAEADIEVCVSLGLLDEEDFHRLKEAGASRVHCNLETSARYFPEVCTTHSFEDKLATLRAAQRAGLSVCSGGILGLGESAADRIDLAISARKLGVTSMPVNLLNPIPGTPYEKLPTIEAEEACRFLAVFRFLLPTAFIRLAGGRGLLADKGEACFCSGANAAITGDMLTTAGISPETDQKLLHSLGYRLTPETP